MKQNGFSIIELMISVTIMCILMILATPTYSSWMSNQRIRSIAEGINLAILQTRSEAIRRNQIVILTINTDTSWNIKDSSGNTINQKTSTETSKNVTVTNTPTNATKLTFNTMGQIVANTDASASLTKVDLSTGLNYAGKRPLRIVVGSGGGSLICYPDVSDNTDTRYCRGA